VVWPLIVEAGVRLVVVVVVLALGSKSQRPLKSKLPRSPKLSPPQRRSVGIVLVVVMVLPAIGNEINMGGVYLFLFY
jgi:hypothetical protein